MYMPKLSQTISKPTLIKDPYAQTSFFFPAPLMAWEYSLAGHERLRRYYSEGTAAEMFVRLKTGPEKPLFSAPPEWTNEREWRMSERVREVMNV